MMDLKNEDWIYDKLRPWVKSIVQKSFRRTEFTNFDLADLEQEVWIQVFKSIRRSYRAEFGTSFTTFAYPIIYRTIARVYNKASRSLPSFPPAFSEAVGAEGELEPVEARVSQNVNCEDLVVEDITKERIRKVIEESSATQLCKDRFIAYFGLDGAKPITYEAIAQTQGVKKQAVHLSIQRVLKKPEVREKLICLLKN